MSKKLKTFLFVLLGVVITAGLGVGGYFLISSLSDVTVYNLCIRTSEGKAINDTSRYLLTNTENKFYIEVDVSTSNGTNGVAFTSTDPSVAKVVSNNGNYYVEYYKAGVATISAYSTSVRSVYDTFTLSVYDNFVSELAITDPDNQASDGKNLIFFGNGKSKEYSYSATGVLAEPDCNNMLIRVVDNYNKKYFKNISINRDKQTITIDGKQVTENSFQVFYLQTYYIDNLGKEHVVKNYAFNVDIIGFRINQMQLLVSEDFHFNNANYVYLSDSAEVSEAYLNAENNETIINDIVLSDTVTDLYFKVRVIYSDNTTKDISYENGILPSEISGDYLNFVGGINRKMNYWHVEVDKEKLDQLANKTDDVVRSFRISYTDETISSSLVKDFTIKYKFKNSQSYADFADKDLYVKVVNDQDELLRYEYKYWDERYRRKDTVTVNGNITGFINPAPNCNTTKDNTISE